MTSARARAFTPLRLVAIEAARRPVLDAATIFRGAAEQLAPMIETWQEILREHGRSASGHCSAATCGRQGYRTRDHLPYPCGARALAEHASRLHD